MKKTLSIILSFVLIISLFSPAFSASAEDAYSYLSSSRVSLHDPSVIKAENGKYYSVGSHLGMAESDDLINWSSLDSSIEGKNYLTLPEKSWKENLAEPLSWTTAYQELVPPEDGNIVYANWANNIVFNKTMNKYCLYGCCSVWGTVISVIWLAVSDDIEGPYEYVDSFVYSGMTVYEKAKDKDYLSEGSKHYAEVMDYSNTNLKEVVDEEYISKSSLESTDYSDTHNFTDFNGFYLRFGAGEYPNAIDPTAFFDAIGDMWLVYGSYSGGCYLLRLDKSTGLPDYSYMKRATGFNVYFGKQISKTSEESGITGEGPFIVYDKISKYYYFYLTYGGLNARDGYNIREYRSKNAAGPYVDAAGNSALDMKNTGLKLMGNYKFDCQKTAYLSGGHSSCLIDNDGSMYQVYHTRFVGGGEGHQLRVHKMARTSDGWAVLLPFEYQGDVNKKVESSDIAGVYEYIDSNNMTQRAENVDSLIEDIILPKQYIKLNANGTISNIKDYSCSEFNTNTGFEEVSGTWSVSGSNAYASFKIGDVSYKGVFAYQKDESKDAKTVLTFSLAGNDNSTIWGVKHSHTNNQISKTAATTSKDGKFEYECTLCGEKSSKTIYKPTAFTLSKTSYVYDGKEKKPSVSVKDSKGNTIDKSNYSLSYTANKAVGTAKVKVSFKNNYSGSKTISYKINPKATSFKTPSITKNAITLKWNKQATQTTGYEVVFSDNSSFKKAKTYKIASKTTSKKFTKLKSKKTYYFKIRTYKKIGSTYYYSSWTKKSIKTK